MPRSVPTRCPRPSSRCSNAIPCRPASFVPTFPRNWKRSASNAWRSLLRIAIRLPPRLPTSSIGTFRAKSSTRRRLIPRLRRWNRREPELVARLGGLLLVALIAQFNYYVLSPNPDFWHHYTIQGVLALWAALGRHLPGHVRSGWQSDKVRVLWSAADIIFLTIEIKLFEQLFFSSARMRKFMSKPRCSWAIPF